jgi:hypothetical protein
VAESGRVEPTSQGDREGRQDGVHPVTYDLAVPDQPRQRGRYELRHAEPLTGPAIGLRGRQGVDSRYARSPSGVRAASR